MNAEQEIERLLREDGATLARDKKHLVWRLSNGNTFTQAHTPGDRMTRKAELSDLRMALGLTGNDGRGTPGERRQKKLKGKAAESNGHTRTPDAGGGLAAQLRTVGVVEDALRAELNEANLEIVALRSALGEAERESRARLEAIWRFDDEVRRLRDEAAKPCACLWCRLLRKVKA